MSTSSFDFGHWLQCMSRVFNMKTCEDIWLCLYLNEIFYTIFFNFIPYSLLLDSFVSHLLFFILFLSHSITPLRLLTDCTEHRRRCKVAEMSGLGRYSNLRPPETRSLFIYQNDSWSYWFDFFVYLCFTIQLSNA